MCFGCGIMALLGRWAWWTLLKWSDHDIHFFFLFSSFSNGLKLKFDIPSISILYSKLVHIFEYSNVVHLTFFAVRLCEEAPNILPPRPCLGWRIEWNTTVISILKYVRKMRIVTWSFFSHASQFSTCSQIFHSIYRSQFAYFFVQSISWHCVKYVTNQQWIFWLLKSSVNILRLVKLLNLLHDYVQFGWLRFIEYASTTLFSYQVSQYPTWVIWNSNKQR